MFETPQEILEYYEKKPRILTKAFIAALPWDRAKEVPLQPIFFQILTYMRDIEKLTEVYLEELRRSPTGKNPWVKKFMERWSVEEDLHGEILHRFLESAGGTEEQGWAERLHREIPFAYTLKNRLYGLASHLVGERFSTIHMVWGAINEMSTLQGYRRLIQLTQNPLLTPLLKGIMEEEAHHVHFYYHMSEVLLRQYPHSQRWTRKILEKFWSPVGEGIRPQAETDGISLILFAGREGEKVLLEHVDGRVEKLPGFSGFQIVSRTIAGRLHRRLDQGPLNQMSEHRFSAV